MGWFGRKAAEVPRPAVPLWLSGETESVPRSYGARLSEVYVNNPVGQRAVRMVAGAVGALPIYALDGKDRVADLVGRAGLMETVAAQLLLHGNAFLQCVVGRDGGVHELFPLRPERISLELDERGWPAAYSYKVKSRAMRIAARDALGRAQVIHLKALNPTDDHLGLGCMDAAVASAAVHNRATRWNKALLDNAARPSKALIYEPADGSTLSSEKFGRLREELERQFSGSDNAGRPLLLEGGLKWESMSLTPADMDFVALKEAAARDIALAFGVPPALLGLPGDAAYANMREAGRALYRQTVLPLTHRILDGIGAGLSTWFGKVKLAADVDQLSELAEDRERLWQQVGAGSFLSDAEKRELLGYRKEQER